MIELRHLRNIPWLKSLTESEMEGVRRAASRKTHPPGLPIFAPSPAPESVFILERGLVRIYRVGSSGSELTLGFIRPMEIFGG